MIEGNAPLTDFVKVNNRDKIILYFNLDFPFIVFLYSEKDWEVVACFLFLSLICN